MNLLMQQGVFSFDNDNRPMKAVAAGADRALPQNSDE